MNLGVDFKRQVKRTAGIGRTADIVNVRKSQAHSCRPEPAKATVVGVVLAAQKACDHRVAAIRINDVYVRILRQTYVGRGSFEVVRVAVDRSAPKPTVITVTPSDQACAKDIVRWLAATDKYIRSQSELILRVIGPL